jgi:hypothetical protein
MGEGKEESINGNSFICVGGRRGEKDDRSETKSIKPSSFSFCVLISFVNFRVKHSNRQKENIENKNL